MSLKNKLLDAARVAVEEERLRIARILDRIEKECVEGVEKKLLREVERHAAEVKLQLARAVIARVRSGIMLGVNLPEAEEPEWPGVLVKPGHECKAHADGLAIRAGEHTLLQCLLFAGRDIVGLHKNEDLLSIQQFERLRRQRLAELEEALKSISEVADS